MRNIIALQKGIIVVPNQNIDNRIAAVQVQAELMKFGYMLDHDALKQLSYADKADIVDFHNEVINYLLDITGGKHNYQPFYPGFPQQVIEQSEAELWFNQLKYYWSNCTFQPDTWTETKKVAFEHIKYKELKSGSENDFLGIFKTLVLSGQSLTPQDQKVISWFVDNYPNLQFPETIPFKENLCSIMGQLIKKNSDFSIIKLPKLTVTDVLRIVIGLSGGDVSMPAIPKKYESVKIGRSISKRINPERDKFKFTKFKRSERKQILALIEHSGANVKEMKIKVGRWIRLGEILHPGEYANQFPKTFKAFQSLRNEKVSSWYGDVDRMFTVSFDLGVNKLIERPGEFLRRLDLLFRNNLKDQRKIDFLLRSLSTVGIKVSNKVLLEVLTHFEKRNVPLNNRSIFIKGARKRTPLPSLPALPQDLIDAIQSTIFDCLKEKFKTLEAMGDCWIDPELKKIPLPTNMRSMSDSLIPTIRGERIPFGEGKAVIRPFIHWYDTNGNEDLDLHGYLIGDKSSISFGFNGSHNNPIGCYSGDVRHRKGACAEYVDISVSKALAHGYKYFIMVVNNYNGKPMSTVKDGVCGVMERDFPEANSSWLPATITNCIKPQSSAKIVLVGAYDLEKREYIHLDLDWESMGSRVSTSTSNEFMKILSPYLELPKISVYDLLQWHVNARGREVQKEVAEKHFLFSDFSGSYTETLKFLGV